MVFVNFEYSFHVKSVTSALLEPLVKIDPIKKCPIFFKMVYIRQIWKLMESNLVNLIWQFKFGQKLGSRIIAIEINLRLNCLDLFREILNF